VPSSSGDAWSHDNDYLIAVLGALLYALAANPKLAELGRIMFFCGLLWTVYMLAGATFAVGRIR